MNNFELAKKYFLDGCFFLDAEDFSQAEYKFKKSLELIPDRVSTLTNLSAAQFKLRKYPEAKATAKKAILLDGANSEVYLNLGLIEKELKSLESAINCFDKALNLKPDYAEAWSNKGNTLHELKYFDEAIVHFNKALSLKPNYAEANSNKGNALRELHHYEEAITHYDKALILKPEIPWIPGDLLTTKMKICSWSGLEAGLETITNKILKDERVIPPFALLALTDDASLHKKSAEIFVQNKFPAHLALGPIPKHSKNNKIRLAYFSADFRNHAIGYLMAELFELHDHNQFELIAFSFSPIQKDGMRQRLESAFHQFIDVVNKSDIEIAQLSRELKIDIAVDLMGFTLDSRTGIFAYRAAPIQVNYLGYPGTMGAPYIDYIVADKTLIPGDPQLHYSEKVVYLPNSYQVNDRKRIVSGQQFTKKALGLPEQGFIFCCFNNSYKILPETFNSWMRILKAVEGSVLWLFQDSHGVTENLKKAAQQHGIDDSRLLFAQRLPLSEHLARHALADLFIDTLPYNAHTTASDALWAGLPVLTLEGQSFASRVAASLLNTIGLPELITSTRKEYETLAIELAMNPKKLAEIKLKLATNRLATPLFNTPLFTQHIEAAYIQMHERYLADLMPDHIYI